MPTRYPLEPIRIYATKQEVDEYHHRLGTIRITEIKESQEMVKNTNLTNLDHISTAIERMHMDPEFWYQQHTLDSDAHHLNHYMIDMIQT